MIVASLSAAVVLFVLAGTLLLAPTRAQLGWHDDDDCQSMVWHTVRVPSPTTRLDMWCLRHCLFTEYGQPELVPFTFPRLRSVRPVANYKRGSHGY
jgi:hypothetical protein